MVGNEYTGYAEGEKGYCKHLMSEPLILEPEDWSPEEWQTICKLFGGLPPEDTERIMVSSESGDTIEYFVSEEEKQKKNFCVWLTESQYGCAHIAARNADEAIEIAKEMYDKRLIDWYEEKLTDAKVEEE